MADAWERGREMASGILKGRGRKGCCKDEENECYMLDRKKGNFEEDTENDSLRMERKGKFIVHGRRGAEILAKVFRNT